MFDYVIDNFDVYKVIYNTHTHTHARARILNDTPAQNYIGYWVSNNGIYTKCSIKTMH